MVAVRWGILSTAAIGTKKVIPAMQQGKVTRVTAIASRDEQRARHVASELGINQAYGNYEALLDDQDVDAVYIPLPNHLHVEWAIRCLQAGKHVLCEKPIGLNAAEAEMLLREAREHTHLKIMEAFMYRHHPQWVEAKRLVREGVLGRPVTIQSFFSYFNDQPENIRNQADFGGGGLMDIGCYPVSLSRFLFERDPVRVCGRLDFDPDFGVDRLTSAILDFGGQEATFTCGTQTTPFQRVNVFGSRGRVEIEIPFNAPPDRPCRLWREVDGEIHETRFDICDQYTIQGDLMSQAILDDLPVPTPLEDAVANMRVLDAIKRSHKNGGWERP
jgi:predicted dehydrogenase